MRILATALLCVNVAIAADAHAQAWPARPIRMIAPVSAGIATDVAARMLAESLARSLGQQVYVENVPGAAGTIGTAAAARAPADGYTLLFGSAGMLSTNKFLFKALPFDLDRDLVPVAIVCRGTPFAVSIYPGLPAKSLPELIALAKARPGKLSYAVDISSGWAGIIGELLNRRAGTDMIQVPYKMTSQAITDTMAGTTQIMVGSAMSVQPYVDNGKLRRIAITAARSFPGMEESRPIAESFPGFVFEGYFGVLVPAATPPAIVDRLSRAIDGFQRDAETAKRLTGFGCIPTPGGTPQAANDFLTGERERWARIVKELNIQPQ
jgi:tripartite-type tricarboxylate transporter receptor subunit TctC